MDITGIGSIADAATSIINKIWPDKTQAEKDAAAAQMAQLMNEYNLTIGQIETNKVEAASPNWFVAGWRPAAGWVGVIGLLYAVLLLPIMQAIASWLHYPVAFPILDTTITMQVLLGMLGLGAMRTIEKRTGTEGNR